MKNKLALLMLFCFIFCLGIINPVQAESALTAKQLLLNGIQKSTFSPPDGLFEKSSGTATLFLKTLGGSLISTEETLKYLNGSQLKFDTKLNSPEKKMEIDYNLSYNHNNYSGSLFIDNNKLILSTEALLLLKDIDPDFKTDRLISIPKYVYYTGSEIGDIWNSYTYHEGQYLPPGFKDLLVFVIEAIPDKYFSASLVNQKVTFSIDQQGLCDIIYSLMQKTVNEKERFASILADIDSAIEPGVNKENIKSEIIAGIEHSVSKGEYPEKPEKIQENLARIIDLEELKYEVSLLPAGQRKLVAVANFIDTPESTAKLTVNTDFTGGNENLNGTYSIILSVQDKEEAMDITGQIEGQLRQTSNNAKSNGSFKLNVKDVSKNATLIDLNLECGSEDKVDKNVQTNIPVLTKLNSSDIESLVNNNSFKKPNNSTRIHVLVEGRPVAFDVPPCDVEGRTMVPVRNLSKALGCEVTWVDPDQINICREDTSITMYIGQQTYTVNGVEKQFDVPPFTRDKTITMVPLRTIAEELGFQVRYDSASKTIFISRAKDSIKQAGPVFSQGPASLGECCINPVFLKATATL
ncbi:copper amine oxidase N-terminal domain-containing protein [Pelotomaculum isophthalicicum JI]|uniref:Copper amine oxidase N-terminal domain-containing protein n=1 Tax=Pelotomaculum isophthalicicum JI TaxID=947010 RepID=A0A9X4H0S8_9FIRM|nr:copper amine oxidase N-terminal domain-containing protein [Pelotomaculum isophthalicicum]MDF9407506.1 copper amine oxidase N-terminal domain-containing protein [Pelotomaculum isophthalicicum JI]